MRIRTKPLGSRNIVGARVTKARLVKGLKQKDLLAQLQVNGVDISSPALSQLEGQVRVAFDKEVKAIADILGVSADWLLGRDEAA